MNKKNTLNNIIILSLSVLILALVSSSPIVYGQTTANTQNSNNNSLPNFLIIVGDDLGFSDIGAFGSEISTPNLDKLANEGKILTNYHTMPVCSPARVSLLTGVDNHIGGIGTMYENIAPNQVGKPGYETYINNKVVTISELLKDAGYNTIMSGKWHLSGKGYKNGTTPYDRGFEESFSLLESGAQHFNSGEYLVGNPVTFVQNGKIVPRPDNTTYSNDLYTNIMLESIKKFKDDGKPLFMYLSFQVAHSPFQAPQDYIKKYEGIYDVGYDVIREKRFDKQKELGIWSSDIQLPTRLPIDKPWSELTSDEQKYRTKVLQAHAAMIDNMDYNIGKVIDYRKEIGKYDNTLILYTSDNGSSEPVEMINAATSGA
ncbi:MAG: sulfatase-like hydrolase/transferase, partial [Nitrososphaeraceae archaeon]